MSLVHARVVPLENIEMAKYSMEKPQTTKGLMVVVRVIDKVFEVGCKYVKGFKKNTPIQFDDDLLKWNYTAIPQVE